MKDAGKWKGEVFGESYGTAPKPGVVAAMHGYTSSDHFIPKHGTVMAPDSIKALVYPAVIQLDDGTNLDIIKAQKWVKTKEVKQPFC